MLFENLLEKPQFAAITKNMIRLYKYVHLVSVHFKNQAHTFWVRNRLCIRAYHTSMVFSAPTGLRQRPQQNCLQARSDQSPFCFQTLWRRWPVWFAHVCHICKDFPLLGQYNSNGHIQ